MSVGDMVLSPTQGSSHRCWWGHYSLHYVGTRTWMSVGTLFCLAYGDQDMDICRDIILSTLWVLGCGWF